MKYYKLIDPILMSREDEKEAVYFGWQKILLPLLDRKDEEGISFLSGFLVNVPAIKDNGELVEKTVLMAKLPEEDEEIRYITVYDFPDDGFSLYYEV